MKVFPVEVVPYARAGILDYEVKEVRAFIPSECDLNLLLFSSLPARARKVYSRNCKGKSRQPRVDLNSTATT